MLQRRMSARDVAIHLSNEALIAEVAAAAGRERHATARLVALLAELDARRLYLGAGCASLFTYCTDVLHLSEHAAYGRIEAARASRRFPGTSRRAGRRLADADGGHAIGAAPHRGKPSRRAGRGATLAQACGRIARRTAAATAGRADSGSQAAGACGARHIDHSADARTGVPANEFERRRRPWRRHVPRLPRHARRSSRPSRPSATRFS